MKSSHNIRVGLFIGVLFLLGAIGTANVALAQNPWDTPQGQACFERWIAYAMARLNAYNGSQDFNSRKPWSINKYGVLEGNPQFGPHSVAAPDDFPRYNYIGTGGYGTTIILIQIRDGEWQNGMEQGLRV